MKDYKYKYIGKEKIDGKEYIKFSMEHKNYGSKYIYYVFPVRYKNPTR